MMIKTKTGIKVSIISALFLAGSATQVAQADHNSHSILPYVAIGVFASMLNNHSHSHRYIYKKKRHHRHRGHAHYGHGGGHYSAHYRRNHNHGGYHYKRKRH